MMNHVNSQIKNRRRNTVIARGKIINIEHNEDCSYLKLFIRNGAGLRHTYLTFRYDPKIFYISKNQYVIITAHIKNKQNQSKIEKQKKLPKINLAVFLVGNLLIQTVSHNRLSQ